MREAPPPEVLAGTLAKLLVAVSSRNRAELRPACDEAKRVLLCYLEHDSSEIRRQKPKCERESPYWRP